MQNDGGVIINIGSIAAKAGWPGRVSYAAAKNGVTGITESLAVEWAKLGSGSGSIPEQGSGDSLGWA